MKQEPGRAPTFAVGIDPSEDAMNAAQWAATEAERFGATLTVVHALELDAAHPAEPAAYPERRRREGAALLGRVSERLAARHPQLRIATELYDLPPVKALVALSEEVDLLVTGTRGHGGFTGMILGSVSSRVVAHARCPVVVMHGAQPRLSPGEIVLGLDFDEAPEPIDYALRTASRLGVGVRAVHAVDPFPVYGGALYNVGEAVSRTREAVLAGMESMLEGPRARHPDVPVKLETDEGHPVPVLMDAARGAHLIVVGSRRSRPPLSFGPGHVVHGLISHSDTPVAVVPIP
jgi:nucleotide-binding universal stress UspA family protein